MATKADTGGKPKPKRAKPVAPRKQAAPKQRPAQPPEQETPPPVDAHAEEVERLATAEAAEREAAEAEAAEASERQAAAADTRGRAEAPQGQPPAAREPRRALATPQLVVPVTAPVRRRRLLRAPSLPMLFALCAYLAAVLVVLNLALPAREAGLSVGIGIVPGLGDDDGTALADTGDADALALRTQAARAAQSTVVVDTRFAQATGFVAWVIQGESYIVTALPAVQGVVEQEEENVFIRRGQRFWRGTIERVDAENQLAMILVPSEVAAPLWQQLHDVELAQGDLAAIVRAGGIGSVQGTVTERTDLRATVTAEGDPMNLGSPLIGANGRLAGIVVGGGSGTATVVPLERACGEIRRCA